MTVSNQARKVVYQGDGATYQWSYDFLIPALGDVRVVKVDRSSGNEEEIAPQDFDATGLGNPAGGFVEYPLSGPALTTSYDIVILRDLQYTQEVDLENQGALLPESIEIGLDTLVMQIQQVAEQLSRTLVMSVADSAQATIPVATARANKQLGFDASGNPIAVAVIDPSVQVSSAMVPVVTAPTINDAVALLAGALLDNLIPAGTVWDYSLPTPPTGFVFPYGQPCTSSYPVYRAALIAAGSPYGNDGTDPLMPDYRSRVAAGKSNMGGVDNGGLTGGTVLGAQVGGQNQTLTVDQLPTDPIPFESDPKTVTGAEVSDAMLVVTNTLVQFGSGPVFQAGQQAATKSVTIPAFTVEGDIVLGDGDPVSVVQATLVQNKILKVH